MVRIRSGTRIPVSVGAHLLYPQNEGMRRKVKSTPTADGLVSVVQIVLKFG